MNTPPPADWLDLPLEELLTLQTLAPSLYRNLPKDMNRNARSYGGHSIAMAMLAASRTVPAERPVSAMQLLFLRGAQPNSPMDYQVQSLQDGKRFSSRHVRASQADKVALSAHVSFAQHEAQDTLQHALPLPANVPGPEQSFYLHQLPPQMADGLARLGSYSFAEKSCIDFKLPDPQQLLAPAGNNRFEFWIRAKSLPQEGPHGQAVAFAYLSDWWINYSSLSAHIPTLEATDQSLYVASLNHALWFHAVHDPREWMLFVCQSPSAAGGRGLSFASAYDQQGRAIASISQECLMANRLQS